MKIALYLLLSFHGLIHLFGFLHAFRLYEFAAFTQPITRPVGVLWLIAFLTFGFTIVAYWRGSEHWWMIGGVALLLSQVLIFLHWSDAKFGTIANVLLFIACLVAWFSASLTGQIQGDRDQQWSASTALATPTAFADLPQPVQRWLQVSGAEAVTALRSVYLTQTLKMKLKPSQKEWYPATATQFFTLDPPAFNWSVDVAMNPLMRVRGRDLFVDGEGAMLMKIWSAVPIVNVSPNEQINEAALQRFLAEIVWFPAMARSPYLKWEAVDAQRAQATLTYGGTSGSGMFYFDEMGNFIKFSTMRYQDPVAGAEKVEWVAEVLETGIRKGVKVPVKLRLTWKLATGDFTWLELAVNDLVYNEEPARDHKVGAE